MCEEEPLFLYLQEEYAERIDNSISLRTSVVENWVDAKDFVRKLLERKHPQLAVKMLVEELAESCVTMSTTHRDANDPWLMGDVVESLDHLDSEKETAIVLFYSAIIVNYLAATFESKTYSMMRDRIVQNERFNNRSLVRLVEDICNSTYTKVIEGELPYDYDYISDSPTSSMNSDSPTTNMNSDSPTSNENSDAEDNEAEGNGIKDDALLAEKDEQLAAKDAQLAAKDEQLAEKDAEIETLRELLDYYTSEAEELDMRDKLRLEMVCKMMEASGADLSDNAKHGTRAKAAELAHHTTALPLSTCKKYMTNRDLNTLTYQEEILSLNGLLQSLGIEWRL